MLCVDISGDLSRKASCLVLDRTRWLQIVSRNVGVQGAHVSGNCSHDGYGCEQYEYVSISALLFLLHESLTKCGTKRAGARCIAAMYLKTGRLCQPESGIPSLAWFSADINS